MICGVIEFSAMSAVARCSGHDGWSMSAQGWLLIVERLGAVALGQPVLERAG